MSKLWVAGSLFLILGIASTLFLINGWEKKPGVSKQSPMASVSLQEVVANRPQWQKYLELKSTLTRGWKNLSAGERTSPDNPLAQRILQQQIDEIERIFNAEVRQKSNSLEKTLAKYIKDRQKEVEILLKDKEADLNRRLTQERADKLAQDQSRIKEFRQQLQFEYQTILSNLQIRRVMLDFSLETKDQPMLKAEIDAEIDRIGREIEEKVGRERIRLQTEYERYTTRCKAEDREEYAGYRRALDEATKREIGNLQMQLQDELEKWRSKRESERDRAVKSRQSGISSDRRRK